jgi:hypothetical protein
MRSPVGHHGYITPYNIGPSVMASSMTSFGGSAVMGVDSHDYPPEFRLNDGFHTTTGGPHLKTTTTVPVALPHNMAVPILQLVTLDGAITVVAVTCVGIAAKRLFCTFRL